MVLVSDPHLLLRPRRAATALSCPLFLLALISCGSGGAERPMTQATAPSASVSTSGVSPTSAAPSASAPVDPPVEPSIPNCQPSADLSDADAQQLFDIDHVPTFDFHLPEADWAALQASARDEEYVQAELCVDGQLVGDVGLRFKGYYGSLFGCFDENDELICSRLSMKVKFDEYIEDQRFYGLKRLNFNAYRHDDSRMKERLTYDLYREMGIVAPRATWAVLRVNGESKGLYGLVEQIDGRFTNDRWPDAPDGNLYKELWPTLVDQAAATDALRTNEETADVGAYTDFAEILSAAPEADQLATLDHYMDLDYLARYMAVDDAVANYDGVTYFWTDEITHTNHNFYVYEQSPERFVLLPWDVEATFWINPEHTAPAWTVAPDDCTQTYPYWEGLALAPGCDPIFQALHGDLDRWRAAASELLDGPFSVAAMTANVDRHAAFIAEAAAADPTPPMYTSFDLAVAELRRVIPDLRARLQDQIDATLAMDPTPAMDAATDAGP